MQYIWCMLMHCVHQPIWSYFYQCSNKIAILLYWNCSPFGRNVANKLKSFRILSFNNSQQPTRNHIIYGAFFNEKECIQKLYLHAFCIFREIQYLLSFMIAVVSIQVFWNKSERTNLDRIRLYRIHGYRPSVVWSSRFGTFPKTISGISFTFFLCHSFHQAFRIPHAGGA